MRFAIAFLLIYMSFGLTLGQTSGMMEATSEDNVYYLKLGNGANAVLMPLPSAPNAEVTLVVTGGSAYESDTMNGVAYVTERILAAKAGNALRQGYGALNAQNTLLSASTNSEQTTFKLTANGDNTPDAVDLLLDKVMTDTIEEEDVKAMLDTIFREIEMANQNPRTVMENRLLDAVYRTKVESINPMANITELNKIDINAVLRCYRKYYVPNNIILLVTGNFKYLQISKQFDEQFNELIRSEFDPDFITKIPDFRPMLYNTQFIIEDSTARPQFQICWQFPGTSSNRQISYYAFLLTEILNDKNNFLQVKAAKMGCKRFEARYEANKYTGIFRVILEPDTAQLIPTYKFVMHHLMNLDKTIVNESMMNSGKLEFQRKYRAIKGTKTFAENVVQHWAYKDDSYYRTVSDSVLSIEEKRFKRFVIEYVTMEPHVTGLLISKADREGMHIDSSFTDLNDSVGNYVFTYPQNVTDLEGTDNLLKLRNLLQWLQINKEVNIQVNGFSDEGEFNKARDKEIMRFLDSIPTFRKVSSDLIEKGYLRPEMMRAIKLVKYLYENGIEADRITGTSMKFSSDSDEEAIANARCTVTLEKLHKAMPLREYHYGKKTE